MASKDSGGREASRELTLRGSGCLGVNEVACQAEGYKEPVKNSIWRRNVILLIFQDHAVLEMNCDPSIVEFRCELGTSSRENLTWYLKRKLLLTLLLSII